MGEARPVTEALDAKRLDERLESQVEPRAGWGRNESG